MEITQNIREKIKEHFKNIDADIFIEKIKKHGIELIDDDEPSSEPTAQVSDTTGDEERTKS